MGKCHAIKDKTPVVSCVIQFLARSKKSRPKCRQTAGFSAKGIEVDATTRNTARLFWIFGIAGVVYLGYVLYRYITLGTYFDHAEPDVAILAWRLASGQPLYYPPGTAEQITTYYGPMLYLLTGLFLKLFGGSIAASKLAAAGSCMVSLSAFSYYAWRRFGIGYVGIGALAFVFYILMIAPVSIWIRPEAHTVLLVTLALFSTLWHDRSDGWITAICVAACAGLAMNFKIHAFIYFVPIVIRYCLVGWLRKWPVMAVVSIGFFFLPFGFPNISISNYIAGIQEFVTSRDIAWYLFRSALKWSQLFLAPVIILGLAWAVNRDNLKRPDVLYFGAFAICVVVTFYPASIPGSTWRQMLPFFPITVDLFIRFLRALEGKRWGWVCGHVIVGLAVVILAISPQRRLLRAFDSNAWGTAASSEIEAIIARYPGKTLQMGYGSSTQFGYPWTYSRPVLAFAGNPVTLSPIAAMERSYAGKPMVPAKLAWIKDCKTDLWLVPKLNHQTFGMGSHLAGGKAFHKELIETFAARYEAKETYEFFQVWACR